MQYRACLRRGQAHRRSLLPLDPSPTRLLQLLQYRAVLAAYGLPLHTNPFYCTCRQSRRLFPELPNHRLETVSQRVGYHLADHHHALADAEACAYIALEVFRDLP